MSLLKIWLLGVKNIALLILLGYLLVLSPKVMAFILGTALILVIPFIAGLTERVVEDD